MSRGHQARCSDAIGVFGTPSAPPGTSADRSCRSGAGTGRIGAEGDKRSEAASVRLVLRRSSRALVLGEDLGLAKSRHADSTREGGSAGSEQ